MTDDRGADLKVYAIRFGKLRLGFQDTSIYSGAYFDVDYFANLAPSFFVQYVSQAGGRPWSRTGNQNAILGLFGDYEGEGWYGYAQLLVDDFNMNRFLKPSGTQNPDKVALSIGGHEDTEAGRFGLYAAAATKYTFEAIGGEFSSFTYFPGSAVDYRGAIIPVPLQDMMIGYVNGENNAAAIATWSKSGGNGLSFEASLEGVISGSKSPANPWHELHNFREGPQGARFLDDPVLEKRITLSAGGKAQIGNVLWQLSTKIGWAQNRLALVSVAADPYDGNQEPIWEPSAESGPIAELRFGGRIAFGL
jgi:hypothetical protein